MKELLRKGYSLLEFECDAKLSSAVFAQASENFPNRNPDIIRWQLISEFWFSKVPLHFAALAIAGLVAVIVMQPMEIEPASATLTLAALFSFVIMLLSFYLPQFINHFMPRLLQLQSSLEQMQATELEKCRKAQLPNDTLVLIWYVLDKSAGLHSIQNSDDYTAQLTRLYGVDRRSIKKSIDLFWGSSVARAEIENRFSEARQFFEALHLKKRIPFCRIWNKNVLQSLKNELRYRWIM